jgi:glycosyltransferase involved in cell wall biosynthesis
MKIIFYTHSSTFDWIYLNYTTFKTIYKEYLNSRYLVSLVPFENDYIFRKWGIKSILFDNFITFDYNSVIQSDLSSKIILMIGRANDKKKRFKIGILSMEYVIQEIPQCQLKIISNLTGINNQKDLIYNLNLENNIKFIGYSSTPEIFFINASLNLFPSITESFGLALSEVKLYGIPNILLGLDYVSISEGGTEIIYDDSPESLSLNIMKTINNNKYKSKLGKEARKSMKKFNNTLLLYKWIDLILSIYNGNEYYEELRKKYQRISEKDAINILNNQINLLNMRKIFKEYINLDFYKNYTLISNLTILN